MDHHLEGKEFLMLGSHKLGVFKSLAQFAKRNQDNRRNCGCGGYCDRLYGPQSVQLHKMSKLLPERFPLESSSAYGVIFSYHKWYGPPAPATLSPSTSPMSFSVEEMNTIRASVRRALVTNTGYPSLSQG